MSLLSNLQNALNKVCGNTMNMYDDSEYDEYWCDIGKHRVYEDAYNHKHKCCYKCFYSEIDHTRYDDGDAPGKEEE